MHRSILRTTLGLLVLLAAATPADAQTTPAAASTPPAGIPRPATDSVFRRARRLVLDGDGAAGRALVDSLLRAAAPGSTAYGDALYWHGALAATAAEAEADYRRVIVEFPLAYYADDALLALAELEQARGDRAGALAHLQRFVREHPASPARGIAALAAARLAFEQRDTRVACAMIAEARASAGTQDVELTNQITYYSSRCPAPATTTVARIGTVPTPAATPVDTQSTATRSGVPRVAPDPLPAVPASAAAAATTPAAVTTSVPTAPAPRTGPVPPTPVRAPPATPRTAPSRGRWTIQLAAYNTRPEAERFVETLKRRNLKARVSGTAKPFRVRLDFYPTRSAAAAEVAALRARGIVGFVAEEVPAP
jgi:cell division septation protein DedD